MTGVPRNRDRPASELTKLERAAMLIYASNVIRPEKAVDAAHSLFDAIEHDRLHRANEAEHD